MRPRPRLSPAAGIAIGPILFILALLAVIAVAISSGSGGFTGSATSDRTSVQLRTQANLIRAKIMECETLTRGNMNADFPAPDGTPTEVAKLDCPGDPAGRRNLWQGARAASLPAAPEGFQPWIFVNHGEDGRCIRIQPEAKKAGQAAIRAGISAAASAFSDIERTYDADSADQKLIIWITRPETGGTC
jgi:hypothetical protein